MIKITYQVRTYCEMQQMGWKEWQQAMQTAKEIVKKYRQMMADAKLLTDEAARKKAEKAAKAVKSTLPGACFQASDFAISTGDDPKKKYNYGKAGRWRDMRYAYLNGLVVIDVDHCGNHALAAGTRLQGSWHTADICVGIGRRHEDCLQDRPQLSPQSDLPAVADGRASGGIAVGR